MRKGIGKVNVKERVDTTALQRWKHTGMGRILVQPTMMLMGVGPRATVCAGSPNCRSGVSIRIHSPGCTPDFRKNHQATSIGSM